MRRDLGMWKEHEKPLTRGQAIAIGKRIDRLQRQITKLVLEVKYGHPLGESIYWRLRDNDFENMASAESCIQSEIDDGPTRPSAPRQQEAQ